MTILYGDTGLVSVGTRKIFNITYPAARETLYTVGTNEVTLPLAEPSTGAAGAVSYTILAGDLPTFAPNPYSVKYSAYIYLSGKNITGSTISLTYTIYKNGVAVSGATNVAHSGIANNQFWTHSHYRNFDVVVGDVIEARVWASATGVYLDYHAFAIVPTRIQVTNSPIVQDLTYTFTNHPTLALGAPNIAVGANWNVYPSSSATNTYSPQTGVSTPFLSINSNVNNVGYAGKVANGDVSISSGPQTNATNHPYYYRNAVPSVISFREVSR